MTAGDDNLTLRTWRRATTLMATADTPLADLPVLAAISAARRRWPALETAPATLVVPEDDLQAAREIARELQDLVADVRQVDGLTGPGWAVAWPIVETTDPEVERYSWAGGGRPGQPSGSAVSPRFELPSRNRICETSLAPGPV